MIDQKLLTFLSVAKTLNLTQTGEELNLTQPAVGIHIKQLEQELGVKLFNRVGHKMSLTNDGEIVLKFARRISSLYNELNTKLSDELKQGKSFTVGITHSSESNIVAEVLATYSKSNPGTTIKIISDTIRNLYDKISTFELDCAIVDGKTNDKKFSSILLDTDSLVAVMSKENPLANKTMLELSDLKKENLIIRSLSSATTNLFISQIESAGESLDDFNIILEIDNIGTIKELVSQGIGISILPKSTLYKEIHSRSLAIKPIKNMTMVREIKLVYLEESINKNFLDSIVNLYKQLTSYPRVI
jgi:DNA-binding transcriptional LysR family regulator